MKLIKNGGLIMDDGSSEFQLFHNPSYGHLPAAQASPLMPWRERHRSSSPFEPSYKEGSRFVHVLPTNKHRVISAPMHDIILAILSLLHSHWFIDADTRDTSNRNSRNP